MMRWFERFLPKFPCPDAHEVEETRIKSARADAEVENQDARIAFTRELVRSNETAAERLVAAMTRDRVR